MISLSSKNLSGKVDRINMMPDHVDRIVEAWRRERPDLDVAVLALVARLFRTAHLADAVLGEQLAAHGLQPGWFDLLAALRRAGEPYALTPTQLMRTMMLSSGGMTKRLDRLAEAGLVERGPDPNDRRGTLVRLTGPGKTTIDALLPIHLANEQRLLASLSPAQQGTLDQLLRLLLGGLEPPQDADRPQEAPHEDGPPAEPTQPVPNRPRSHSRRKEVDAWPGP
jgi:DNA-binding MarR family transcriptional regulator